MNHYFQINKDEFMEHHHKRSTVETTNAAIKRKFRETLTSKNETAQVNEFLAKIIAYNLTVVIRKMYENGIELSFHRVLDHSRSILSTFTLVLPAPAKGGNRCERVCSAVHRLMIPLELV